MRRTFWIGLVGVGLVGIIAVSIGTRPTLKAQQTPGAIPATVVGGAFGGADPKEEPSPPIKIASKPMTLIESKILWKLQEKVTMNFPNETPLEDLIKYVQKSTIDKVDFPDGIPIYLNPQGLQDADKTPKSTVLIDLKGIPLATTLKLALKQIGLDFWIHPDGLIIVTYDEDDEIPVDAGKLIVEELTELRHEVRSLRNELRFAKGAEPLPHQGPSEPRQTPAEGAVGGFR